MKRKTLKGVIEISQVEFKDNRGSFIENFNSKKFKALVRRDINFVQDNLSTSKKVFLEDYISNTNFLRQS